MHDEGTPEGGDAACWAHMFEQEPEEQAAEPAAPKLVDLMGTAKAATRSGPAWTGVSDDLNVNLLVFQPGEGVAEHVNAEVDVLVIGIRGVGIIAVDGVEHPLRAGGAILIPKGARRGTQAGDEALAYLTCHRRRAGLWPTFAPRRSKDQGPAS
jgi:quercetin dioxygenase-like cupin family protein